MDTLRIEISNHTHLPPADGDLTNTLHYWVPYADIWIEKVDKAEEIISVRCVGKGELKEKIVLDRFGATTNDIDQIKQFLIKIGASNMLR